MRSLIRSLLLTAACAIAWQPASAAKLSAEQFTREYVKAVKAAMPAHKVEIVKPLQVRIRNKDGEEEATAYLDNAYNQALRNPDAKEAIIKLHAASIASQPAADAPIDPANIIPVIKDRGWVAETARSFAERGGQAPEYVTEDLNSELVIVYAEDSPRSIRYFSAKKLEEIGFKRADLRARATENLKRILPDIEVHKGPLFSMLTAGGDFEASLLLIDDIWTGGAFGFDGEIVVAVPARDVLLITGSNDAAGLAKVEELARATVGESSYALTTTLFVYRAGKFEPFRR